MVVGTLRLLWGIFPNSVLSTGVGRITLEACTLPSCSTTLDGLDFVRDWACREGNFQCVNGCKDEVTWMNLYHYAPTKKINERTNYLPTEMNECLIAIAFPLSPVTFQLSPFHPSVNFHPFTERYRTWFLRNCSAGSETHAQKMRWNTYRKKHTALIREIGCGEKKEETERYSVWREKKQRSRIQVVSCGDNKQQSSQHVWTESTWRESRNRAGLCRPEHHRRELDLLCNTRRERERSETGLQIKNRNTYSYTQYTQKHNVELEHTQHTAEIGYIRDSINRAVIFIQWWI